MLGATLLTVVLGAQAFGQPDAPKILVDLLPSHDVVVPGDRFALLVKMDISEPWHIYWKNPGDSGLPTRIVWSLPPGWEASQPEFLAPHRLVAGDLISYGFEDHMTMLTWVTVSADAQLGSVFEVKGKVSWLACIEQCIPGDAEISASIRAGRSPVVFQAGMDGLRDFRASSPKMAPTDLLQVVPEGEGYRLIIKDGSAESPFFFADSYDDISPGAEQVAVTRGGHVELSLVKSPYSKSVITRLKGILTYIDGDGKRQEFAVNLPVSLNTSEGENK